METCENCGRAIGKLETPYVTDDNVVCAECYDKIKASREPQRNTPVAQNAAPAQVVHAEHDVVEYAPPARRRSQTYHREQPRGNGAAMALGIGSLVMGIVALLACWIPFVGCISIPFAALGILIGLIGVIMAITTAGRGIGFPIGGVLCSGMALVVFFIVTGGATSAIGTAMEDAVDEMGKARLERLENELADLQSEQQQLEKNKQKVRQVSVRRARLIWSNDFSSTPSFDLRVYNTLDEPVTRIYMRGKATSPNRPLPYGEDTFNYSPPGGMNPKSDEEFLLRPSFLSSWDRVPRDDEDVRFEVDVVGIETPNGKYMTELPERKLKRLEELPQEIEEAKKAVSRQ